ncbi:MAG: hypothetical protein H6Q49_1526, partial [Deltaproteobacteria bacterium]|nr:hypothetical protein [Deltaproteobacteria bacterium]
NTMIYIIILQLSLSDEVIKKPDCSLFFQWNVQANERNVEEAMQTNVLSIYIDKIGWQA